MRRRFMNENKIYFDYTKYMTIEALDDEVVINLQRKCEYGIDGIGWMKSFNIVAQKNQFISFKNILKEGESFGKINIVGKCRLHGNSLSLIFGDQASENTDISNYTNSFSYLFYECLDIQDVSDDFLPSTKLADSCYMRMFYGCTNLKKPPKLPATSLKQNCYLEMFRDCKSLTVAPELPATTLANYCYQNMFDGCISLATAPELPATTLAYNCYNYMFYGCSSLVNATELPATTLASSCYNNMFSGCTSLTTAPELPATILDNHCYEHMFSGCTSLTTAPELPATTLGDYCYYSMFQNCTSLISAPELPAATLTMDCYHSMFSDCTSLITAPKLPSTSLTVGCYDNMFRDCTSLTSAPELPATTLAHGCYSSMFRGCTNLVNAPELPATILASSCYKNMFSGCTSLNYIKMLATDISAVDCLYYWVYLVSSTGTFVKSKDATWSIRGISGIPSDWTVITDEEESGGIFPATLIPTIEENLTNYNIAKYFVDNYPDMVVDDRGAYTPITEDLTIEGTYSSNGKVIGVAKWIDGNSLLFFTDKFIIAKYTFRVFMDMEGIPKGYANEFLIMD